MFEFNSDRKRMTVLLREDNILKLYIKGADNVIRQRLNMKEEQPFLEDVNNNLQIFSVKGFRTLVLAMRIVEEEEYQTFCYNLNQCNEEKEVAGYLIVFNVILIKCYKHLVYLYKLILSDKKLIRKNLSN